MKKLLKNKFEIIAIFVAIILLVGVYFISDSLSNKYYEKITYSDLKKIVKEKESFNLFVGDDEDYIIGLKLLGKSSKTKSYYLNSSSLSEDYLNELYGENLQVASLFTYKKGAVSSVKNVNLDSITLEQYFAYSKQEGYNFLFIGSSTCGYCTKFKPEIKTALLNTNNINFYYLDLSTLSEDELNSLYNSDSYFNEEEWGTPLNFLYKDGERVAVLNGYNSYDNLYSFLKTNGAL